MSSDGTVLAYHDVFTAQAGELGETPAGASKPPAASKPSAVSERQRPASDERRSQTERQGSVPRQLDGNAGSRTDRKAAEKEAESECYLPWNGLIAEFICSKVFANETLSEVSMAMLAAGLTRRLLKWKLRVKAVACSEY